MVILWLHYRIVKIEEALEEIHKEVETTPAEGGKKTAFFDLTSLKKAEYTSYSENLQTFCTNIVRQRPSSGLNSLCLLTMIDEYTTRYSTVRARRRATSRQINNVKNWAACAAITSHEMKCTSHEGDLISISSRAPPSLHPLLNNRLIRGSPFFCKRRYSDTHITSAYTSYASETPDLKPAETSA
jgi:hypothetical protein